MSTNTSPPTKQTPPYGPGQPPPRKTNRVFLWVFVAIQVIFVGWVVYKGVSAPQNGGVAIQMGTWVLTDVVLGVIYMICQLPRTPR